MECCHLNRDPTLRSTARDQRDDKEQRIQIIEERNKGKSYFRADTGARANVKAETPVVDRDQDRETGTQDDV